MAHARRARRFAAVVPRLVAAVLVLAAAGCNDNSPSPAASPAPGVSASAALSAQGLSVASATPEMFRNLGKRGESAL